MRKKNLLALTVIALTVFLVACGSNEVPQTPTATAAPTSAADPTVVPTETAQPTVTPTEAAQPMVAPTAEPTKAMENTEPTAMPTKAPEKELTNDPVPEVEEAYSLTFSRYTGVYSNGFGLAMAASDETAEIYYTLDGSNPLTSKTAMQYSGTIPVVKRTGDANVVSAIDPVLFSGSFNYVSKNAFKCEIKAPLDDAVDKCTVVRAVAKYANGIISDEVSATYFIGTMEEHIKGLAESCAAAEMPLSVISISANYDDLFGENGGIYMKGKIFEGALKQYLVQNGTPEDGEVARSLDANYKRKGRAWEKEVRVSFMEVTPEGLTEVLTQNCGIRIQGNYSRSDLQKGLRLYARDDYGKKNFKYAFFGEDYVDYAGDTMDKFKTLVLRNGGNCAFTSKFNDTYWQSLVSELDCGTQKSRPCVVYINGEYWGLYVLQEDYTDNHMENLYGVDNNAVVIYKGDAEALELGYKLDEGEIPEGEDETYYFNELLNFFDKHDNLADDADYAEFCKLVHPQSVMDYFAVQCFINNKWDWPGKNWSMWKTIISDGVDDSYGDGRWRFLFYDMEFGGVSGEWDARTNTIKEDNYKPEGLLDFDTDNPAVLCFAYCMTNQGFRREFNRTLLGLSEGVFEKNKALERLEEFEAIYGPLFEQFFERYSETGSTENALEGGYASAKCIRDFLKEREKYIQKMVDYVIKKRGE